jgi:hypothetical protein
VAARAKVSAKRWSNLRTDLAAAIAAAGLRPMVKTAGVELDETWKHVLADATPRIARGISRLARWGTLRGIGPQAVDTATIVQFVGELADASLVRQLRYLRSRVSRRWNEFVSSHPDWELRSVELAGNGRLLKRVPWQSLPASFRHDVARYLHWGPCPIRSTKGHGREG